MNDADGRESPESRSQHDKQTWIPRFIEYIKHQLQQRRAKKQKEVAADRAARSTARATWAIAGFTLVMVGVSTAQWLALRQADETTREAFTAVQRAFIVVDGLHIVKKEEGVPSWEIKPIVKNSGNTPTRNLVFTALFVQLLGEHGPRSCDVELPNVPSDPASVFYLIGASKDHRSLAVLGPQATLPFSPTKHQITESMFNRMKALGYVKVVGSGAVMYNDVFPHTKQHITKYCFVISPETGSLDVCGYWNCADEECKADAEAYNKALEAAFRKAGKSVPEGTRVPVDFPY